MRSQGAGCTIRAASTGRVLLLRRSPTCPPGGVWSIPAGGVDRGETAIFAALRELEEETGFCGDVSILFHSQDRHFLNLACEVKSEFRVRLNWENDAAGWFDIDDLPDPLYRGLRPFLRRVVSW